MIAVAVTVPSLIKFDSIRQFMRCWSFLDPFPILFILLAVKWHKDIDTPPSP